MLRKLIALALAALLGTAVPGYASAAPQVTKKTETVKQEAVGVAKPGESVSVSKTERTTTTETKPQANAEPGKDEGKPKEKTGRKSVRRAPYHAFCQGGLPSTDELADRLAASINADTTGRTPIKGCRATPVQFLAAFKKGADEPDLTLAGLPNYVRTGLERTTIDRSITWWSSCIRGASAGPEDVIMKCQKDTVPAGVAVYRDKKTGRIAIKLDCANPGLVPVSPPPCAAELVRIPDGAAGKLAVSEWGEFTPEEESLCPLSIQGPRVDGTRFGARDYRPLTDETGYPCDWSGVARDIKLPLHKTACVRVTAGWYLIRGPLRLATDIDTRLVDCLLLDNGRTVHPLGALPETYRKQKNGWYLATVWSSEEAVSPSYRPTYMWWHWAN